MLIGDVRLCVSHRDERRNVHWLIDFCACNPVDYGGAIYKNMAAMAKAPAIGAAVAMAPAAPEAGAPEAAELAPDFAAPEAEAAPL